MNFTKCTFLIVLQSGLGGLLLNTAAHATTVDAVSFARTTYSFAVNDGAWPAPNVNEGASPDGISTSTGGPMVSPLTVSAAVDDPEAVVAIDTSNTQVGCASCTPPYPYLADRERRVNRTDPTEFADAQYDVSVMAKQDEGNDVSGFAIGSQEVELDGLAQLRITSNPVDAAAQSAYGSSRVTTFQNITHEDIEFMINGRLDTQLQARYTGADGYARTSTSHFLRFSGLPESNVNRSMSSWLSGPNNTTGSGASVIGPVPQFPVGNGFGLTAEGFDFAASATAVGDGGFNEANYSYTFRYRFFVTLEAGQSFDMQYGYSQVNDVQYTPTELAPVPIPASQTALFTGLLVLGGIRQRAKHKRSSNLV